MSLKAETIVQTLVAMLVFLTALLLTFSLFARLNVSDDDPFALAQAEEQVRSVIDDYKSGRQSTVPAAWADAEHAQTTEYEWGNMTVYAVPYKDYPDLAQLSVVAKIPSSRKEIRRTVLVEVTKDNTE